MLNTKTFHFFTLGSNPTHSIPSKKKVIINLIDQNVDTTDKLGYSSKLIMNIILTTRVAELTSMSSSVENICINFELRCKFSPIES